MSHAVLTLRGLDTGRDDRMGGFCRGYARTDGRTQIVVDYGDGLFDSYLLGADLLDDAVSGALRRFEHVTVMGHSKGAVVAGLWLGDADPDPSRIDLILLGNPGRRLGGDGPRWQRTPDNTGVRVRDVARRWDGHANGDNWPDRPGAFLSRTRLWLGSLGGAHRDYEQVDLSGPLMLREQAGGTAYLVAD